MRDDEQRNVNVVGQVVEVSPPTRLVITWSGESPSRAEDPEAYSRVTFDVNLDGELRLAVSHDELEAGSGMAKGVTQG